MTAAADRARSTVARAASHVAEGQGAHGGAAVASRARQADMHARPVRIFALGAIALGGCVGTDGLTGGPTREQAPAGSASPAPVAPPPDAPAAPAADASAPDSVPRWCDAHPGHTLCEDFDELPLADEPWDALTQSGGPLALVPQGASTAKTLLATLVAGRPDLAGTYVAKSLASSRHLHVEADLRVERGDDAADLDLVVLRFAPDGQVADSWVNLAYAQGILVVGAGEFLTDGGFAGAAARVGVDTSV